MAKLYASPTGGQHLYGGADRATTTFQQAIAQAQPGDEILLLPGVYDVPVTIKGKQAGENPIVVRGDTRATLDGRRSVLRPPDTIKSAGNASMEPPMPPTLREDKAIKGMTQGDALKNAPAISNGCIKVPQIIE